MSWELRSDCFLNSAKLDFNLCLGSVLLPLPHVIPCLIIAVNRLVGFYFQGC